MEKEQFLFCVVHLIQECHIGRLQSGNGSRRHGRKAWRHARRWAETVAYIALVQQLDEFFWSWSATKRLICEIRKKLYWFLSCLENWRVAIDLTLCGIFFLNKFECGSQIPHLYRSVTVAGQNESSRHRTHSRWFLAFVDTKWCDNGAIDGFDDAHSITIRCQTYVQLIRVWDHFLNKNLLVILLAEGPEIVASRIAVWAVSSFQRHNL